MLLRQQMLRPSRSHGRKTKRFRSIRLASILVKEECLKNVFITAYMIRRPRIVAPFMCHATLGGRKTESCQNRR